MERQDEQSDAHVPEVTAALRDFTHLCLSYRPTQTEEQSTVAAKLLERLITLCEAQHGAIMLALLSSPSRKKALLTFAVLNMKEEEVHTLLTPIPQAGMWTFPPSREPSWLIWNPDIALSFPQEHSTESERESDKQSHSFQMLLVFGWDEQDEEKRASLVKKGRVLLPLITEGVAAVISTVLLSERVSELETSAGRNTLQEMYLLKAELLASVSHELRSPLASIKGYAATLLRHERRIAREERHEFLLAIHEASDRLANVIDHLLEMSEFETGMITLELTAVNVTHLLHEAVVVAQQRLQGSTEAEHPEETPSHRYRTFTVRFEGTHGRPMSEELIIQADHNRLREVLDQVVENAVHHSPADSNITIVTRLITAQDRRSEFDLPSQDRAKVFASVSPRNQQMVEICVHNDGRGIPASHLERIFDPFYRVDTSLTREDNGLGLGLTICKRIVELHGGFIWAESEVGRGSTFRIRLPVDRDEEHHEAYHS